MGMAPHSGKCSLHGVKPHPTPMPAKRNGAAPMARESSESAGAIAVECESPIAKIWRWHGVLRCGVRHGVNSVRSAAAEWSKACGGCGWWKAIVGASAVSKKQSPTLRVLPCSLGYCAVAGAPGLVDPSPRERDAVLHQRRQLLPELPMRQLQ